MNKKQLKTNQFQQDIKNKWLAKKLSNIEQDLQMQSEIRMPIVYKTKKKTSHTSQKQLNIKLKRIINLNTSRKKNTSSLQNQPSPVTKSKQIFNSQYLPQLKPLTQPKRNKSSLDKILMDQSVFAKQYFDQIHRTQKFRKNHPEEYGVEFQFPQIKVNNWAVRGYLKQNHILLKAIHKDTRVCIKKYAYDKVYEKLRRDYQTWVESKFCFES